MNLVVDAGNTAVKIGVFDKDELIFQNKLAAKDLQEQLKMLFDAYAIEHTIVSSVSTLDKREVKFIKTQSQLLWLDASTKVPFTNRYQTPKTLGVDRLALTAAAVGEFPKQHVLVIDTGTCITYDFKNANEEYLGGAISPGMQMRYNAMHNQTANLPLLEPKAIDDFVGDSTEEAMHVGVVEGVLGEISGMISKYQVKYEHLTVILTGGDAPFLAKRLKNTIFAVPNFLLQGMNYILEYNKDQ